MKNTSIHSLAAILVASLSAAVWGDGWESDGVLPAGKQHAFAVERSGVLYAIGGTPWVNEGDMDGSVYQRMGGVWSSAAPLDGTGPTIPMGGGVDALGRIVFFGGISIKNGDDGKNKVYDPLEGPQASIADPPDNVNQLGFAFAVDDVGRLYWLGGGDGPTASGFCARYTATGDSWATLANMPVPVRGACACYDGAGHILLFGGVMNGGIATTADVQRFDIASGTWSNAVVPDLPSARSGARAVLGADNRIYLIGGLDAAGVVQGTVYTLNLATNTWTESAPLSTPRHEFAAALGADDYIYVVGGSGEGGEALSSVERRFTAVCPEIPDPPVPVIVWTGQTATLPANVTGGEPLGYQWLKDGIALGDGPTGSGSSLSGTDTALLVIENVQPGDTGSYGVTATNDCGSVTGLVATLDIATPPAVPANWVVTNLHPSWAEASSLTCIGGGKQGGWAQIDTGGFNDVSQPMLWQGTAESAINVTPPGSVGGGINDIDIDGEIAVGWWWWPYQCYVGGQWYTCYSSQAAKWVGSDPPAFSNLQWSGWENSSAAVVRNGVIGGSVTHDDNVGNVWWHALLWDFNGYFGYDLHPPGVSSSSVAALDGASQYGSILTPYPAPTFHAARWSGSPATFVDLHPAGSTASRVVDAADGLQVGYTGYPYDGAKACLWAGSAQSYKSLHPAGAALSRAFIVARGIVVGDATIGGVPRTGYWSVGDPTSFHEWGDELKPPGFSSVSVADLSIGDDGVFILVGSGYNTVTARTEALMWTSSSEVFGDLDGDGSVGGSDLAILLGAWGTADKVADLDGDGSVGAADLALLLGAWR